MSADTRHLGRFDCTASNIFGFGSDVKEDSANSLTEHVKRHHARESLTEYFKIDSDEQGGAAAGDAETDSEISTEVNDSDNELADMEDWDTDWAGHTPPWVENDRSTPSDAIMGLLMAGVRLRRFPEWDEECERSLRFILPADAAELRARGATASQRGNSVDG